MTTVIMNDMPQMGISMPEQMKRYPKNAQMIDRIDQTPLPVPESELLSLEEFKLHMEELAQTQLGLNLKL